MLSGMLLMGPALAGAQEVQTDSAATGQAAPAAGAGAGGGPGFSLGSLVRGVSSIGDNLRTLATGANADKALLAQLPGGAYLASNEAIGEARDIESKRVEHHGLVPIKTYQAYADALYQRLKQASGMTGLPGSVHLLASSELKATSSADGNVFLSLGWVRSITSEDELAALLAHELSHVLLRHHDSTVVSRAQKQLQWVATGAALLKNQIDKAKLPAGGLSPGQSKSLQHMQLLIELTDGVVLPAWTRGQELDADRMAVDLLRQTGYSVTGMTEFIEHVASWEALQAEGRKRMDEQLQRHLETMGAQGQRDAVIKTALAEVAQRGRGLLAAQHEGADKRREEVAAYLDKHHADMPRVAIRRNSYQALLAQPMVKPLLDGYGQTFEAMALLEKGQVDDALRLLDAVTRAGASLNQHALPNYQLFVALRSKGRHADAIKALERGFLSAEPAWKPFEAAMRVVAANGKRDRALQIADEARLRFKDAPALAPELVGIYTELGFKEQAQQALGQCTLQHVSYRELCQQRSQRR